MNESSENRPEEPQDAPQPQDAQVEDGEALEEEELEDQPNRDDVFLRTMAKAMPWVISMLFHVGLFLLMTFFVFLVMEAEQDDAPIVPNAILSETPGAMMVQAQESQNKSQTKTKTKRKMRKEKVQADTGETNKPLDTILSAAKGSSGGASGGLNMATGGGGGPRNSFFGSGGNAYNVVYVIDRSGSMVHTFQVAVRPEMLRSIGRLRDSQMFHIILFSDEQTPLEFGYKKLVPATKRNKIEAAQFLMSDEVTPMGRTDPVPAIRRAMAVLQRTRKKGKLIYLLSDSMDNVDQDRVLKEIGAANKDKKVHINTFLYGTEPKQGFDLMVKIAEQNGGVYKFINN
jgi:Mg-chelatase subunit ChlD